MLTLKAVHKLVEAGTKSVVVCYGMFYKKEKGDKELPLYLPLMLYVLLALFKVQFHPLAILLAYYSTLVVRVGNQKE
jgi:hypothetical protein